MCFCFTYSFAVHICPRELEKLQAIRISLAMAKNLQDVTSRDEQLRNFANRLGLQPTVPSCLELTPGHSGDGLDVEG